MQSLARHRLWIGAAVSLSFGLTLTWGLLRFGAAETPVLNQLFLLLLIPSLLALISPPWSGRIDLRLLVLTLLGLFLLGQVALRPTLEARGYLHLAVGWLALWLSLWLAQRSRGQRRFLLVVLVLLGALEAFYGLVQSVGGYDYIGVYFRNRGRLATGTLINRNHFAALLNMLWPLALGMLYANQGLARSDRIHRSETLARTWIVLLGCSVMGVAVLLSQSRGGALSLLMTLIFMAVLLSFSRRGSQRRGLSGAVAGVLVLLVVGMGMAFGLEALFERFGRVDERVSRVEVYQDTVDMIADSPVVGVGPGMYEWRFRLYQTTQPHALYSHAHNDYLQSAAEWGIPLAILGWSFVFWRFYSSSQMAISARQAASRGLSLGTAGALFSIMVHSLVDFSLQIPAVVMIFGCILGLSWSLEFKEGTAPTTPDQSDSSARATGTTIQIALRCLLLLALLAAGFQTLQRFRSDRSAKPENGVPGLEQAVLLDPRSPEPQYLLGMAYRDLPGFGDLTEAAQRFRKAVGLNPYAWRYWLEFSRVQELLGDLDQAEASLQVAVDLNPGSGQYRWRLANLMLRRANIDNAVEEMSSAVGLEPGLAQPAIVLLLKSGVDVGRIEALLPKDRTVLMQVMRMILGLARRQDSAAAENPGYESLLATIWTRLLSDSEPLPFAQGQAYVIHLFRSDRFDEAREAWRDLADVNGIHDPAYAEGANAVWNGDFALDTLGDPLGWRIWRADAFKIQRVDDIGRQDSTALQIEFHGTENLDFAAIAQELILESGRPYSFAARLRSEDLSTDQGVFIEVISRDPRAVLVSTDPVRGTSDWRQLEAAFTMPEGSGRAVVRVRRRTSQQIDNRLRGKVYVDSIKIEPLNR